MALTDQALASQVAALVGPTVCTDAFFNKGKQGFMVLFKTFVNEYGMDPEFVVPIFRNWIYGDKLQERTGVSNFGVVQEQLLRAVGDAHIPLDIKQNYSEHIVTNSQIVSSGPTKEISFPENYVQNMNTQMDLVLTDSSYEIARGKAA